MWEYVGDVLCLKEYFSLLYIFFIALIFGRMNIKISQMVIDAVKKVVFHQLNR